jgi:hypothetical protein
MQEEEMMTSRSQDDIHLQDLNSSMTVCSTFDPGQDEFPDPDDDYPKS